MPVQIEHEGVTKTFYTQEEVDAEVKGLKVTNENLKNEKAELKGKLDESSELVRTAQEEAAKAAGDKDALERISIEREQEAQNKLTELTNSIKKEKVNNAVNDLVTELGAGGAHNEDLRDLIKSRFSIDYDTATHELKVSGNGASSLDELKKTIKESGRYDAYLAGTGSTGGRSNGSTSTGAATDVNPFKKETLNLTEQARILKEDPTLAAQLKASA